MPRQPFYALDSRRWIGLFELHANGPAGHAEQSFPGKEVRSQSGAFGHEPYRRRRLSLIRNEEQRNRVPHRVRGQRRAIRSQSEIYLADTGVAAGQNHGRRPSVAGNGAGDRKRL